METIILGTFLAHCIGIFALAPFCSASSVYVIVEGSDSRILRVAAGHVPGTALPGTIGNVGIAAHRVLGRCARFVPVT